MSFSLKFLFIFFIHYLQSFNRFILFINFPNLLYYLSMPSILQKLLMNTVLFSISLFILSIFLFSRYFSLIFSFCLFYLRFCFLFTSGLFTFIKFRSGLLWIKFMICCKINVEISRLLSGGLRRILCLIIWLVFYDFKSIEILSKNSFE